MDGFLCINKPRGPSSFQIVKQVRQSLRIGKAGHAGTLDPYATGLLVVALGSSTRLMRFLPGEPKIYRFGIQFGTQTDSFDSEGKVTVTGGKFPEAEELQDMVNACKGEISQTPPRYSAVKVNGVRAYKLARGGEEFTLRARPVKIYSLVMTGYDGESGLGHFELCCSGGTYVRALVRDMATGLGTCGYAGYIQRISSGCFSIDQAMEYQDLGNAGKYIIPAANVFRNSPSVQVSNMQRDKILKGIDIEISGFDSTWVFAFMDNNLLAVLETRGEAIYHPVTVLSAGGQ